MPPRLLQKNGESYTHLHRKNELIWQGLQANNIISLAHCAGIYVVNTWYQCNFHVFVWNALTILKLDQ